MLLNCLFVYADSPAAGGFAGFSYDQVLLEILLQIALQWIFQRLLLQLCYVSIQLIAFCCRLYWVEVYMCMNVGVPALSVPAPDLVDAPYSRTAGKYGVFYPVNVLALAFYQLFGEAAAEELSGSSMASTFFWL